MDKAERRAIPGNSRRLRKGRRLSPIRTLVLGGLLLLLIIVLLVNIDKFLKVTLVDVRKAERAVLEDTYDTSFIILRNETTVSAPVSGRVEYVAREGERVAKDRIVGYINYDGGTSLEQAKRAPLAAPKAGIVSFRLDGYEGVCSPLLWPQLDVAKLQELEKGLGTASSGEAKKEAVIQAGETLFKIVDNLDPLYLFFEMPRELTEVPPKGGYVDVRLDEAGDVLIRGRVQDSYLQDNQARILLQIPSLSGLEHLRLAPGKIIKNRFEGFILKESELVYKEETAGVYTMINGRAQWAEVKVLGKGQQKVCVEGLKEGCWLITAPKYVVEGQRVFTFRK